MPEQNNDNVVPVIDMKDSNRKDLIEHISNACSTFGFFQIIHHGISPELIDEFRTQMKCYFDLPHDEKLRHKRNERNARGFFDDELTKQRRDWKEAIDIGVPGSRDWSTPDNNSENACLDGFNQFPHAEDLPNFRPTIVKYFEACSKLSDELAILMAEGLGCKEETMDHQDDTDDLSLVGSLRRHHTSYLRMNYYPVCPSTTETDGEPQPLGISPHKDAGFLTVLVQDDDCHSLQVARHTSDNENDVAFDDMDWFTVKPVPGALTINTGDMAMIWSNGQYKAPLHRVKTDPIKVRYSAPFFYNPGYSTLVEPLRSGRGAIQKYKPCLWGYFRALRFAGDLTDLGVEIQISDFEESTGEGKAKESDHIQKQVKFSKMANFHEPFSVEKFRPLLQGTSSN
eukprot:CAMPEP_0195301076 /NCGR_PEP_ID=MMETSP0707-20130614/28688_1 /TAXON_ID=33640 /ORGANISM="Asterionellopsis glacialis, Strain CCMP134" /LENGTH=397 /DNA_ID=CAMNT_0040363931 /DNA_START=44 /DNA_END=1237 /DNA_ORIENTATION=+